MSDLIPYLCAPDASAAIEFYVRAFGAREVSRWTDPDSGRIGHAELDVAGRRLFLSDEWPDGGVLAPREGAGTSVSLVIEVDDADAVVARAVDLGAVVERPVTESHGDRGGWLHDPAGHRWNVSSRVREMTGAELQDEIGDAYRIT